MNKFQKDSQNANLYVELLYGGGLFGVWVTGAIRKSDVIRDQNPIENMQVWLEHS